MKRSYHVALSLFAVCVPLFVEAAQPSALTPIRKTTTRGSYTIDTIGDTLGQASPQNARLIIRVSGADKKLVKPDQISLIDKSGAAINPVFREDRKVKNEENTGLPLSLSPQTDSRGRTNVGVGVNLNKVLGPRGDYAYTKVDWPKSVFTADKKLQIVVQGKAHLLALTSLAK